MATRLQTRFLAETEYETWNAFVSGSPDGSPYSNCHYLDALCEAAGGNFRVLVVESPSELLAGCALYETRSRWGAVVRNRLLLQYNGIVTKRLRTKYPSEACSQRLRAHQALEVAIVSQRYAAATLKSRPTLTDVRSFAARGWRAVPAYTYVVPLTDLAVQWNLVEQNCRRLIRRAEKEGLQFSDDTDFDALYRLHYDTHIRKGAPLYLAEVPFRRFVERLLAQRLAHLYHARTPSGASAASQLVLTGAHPVSHTACAGADPSLQNSGASAFLRWRAFVALAELGSTANDLTDASLNPVTHFKSQFGGNLEVCFALVARPTRLYRYGMALEDGARSILAEVGWRRR